MAFHNLLHAIDLSGTRIWKKEFPEYWIASTPSIGVDGTIYVPSLTNIYALKPTGETLWTLVTGPTDLNAPLYYPTVGNDKKIYTYSSNGHIFVVA